MGILGHVQLVLSPIPGLSQALFPKEAAEIWEVFYLLLLIEKQHRFCWQYNLLIFPEHEASKKCGLVTSPSLLICNNSLRLNVIILVKYLDVLFCNANKKISFFHTQETQNSSNQQYIKNLEVSLITLVKRNFKFSRKIKLL